MEYHKLVFIWNKPPKYFLNLFFVNVFINGSLIWPNEVSTVRLGLKCDGLWKLTQVLETSLKQKRETQYEGSSFQYKHA